MDNNTAQQQGDSFLQSKIEKARELFKEGGKMQAAYWATIAGMWTNAFKRPYVNPFDNDDAWLYKWFQNGYDDFTKAVGMTIEIRKKQLNNDANRKSKVGQNSNGWGGTKLW